MDRVYITSILLALAEANLIQAFADIEAATGDTKKSDQLKKQAELVLDFRSKIDGIMKPEEVKVTKASERLKDHDKVIETVDRLPGGPHRAQIMKAFQKLQIAVAYNRAALDQAQEIVMNPPGARYLLDPRIADLFGIISGLPSEAKEQINLVGEIGTALGKYLETRAFSPPTPEEVRVAIKKESSRQIDRFKKINEKRWPGELNKAAGDKLADLAKKAADGIIEESVFPGSSSSWSSLLGA